MNFESIIDMIKDELKKQKEIGITLGYCIGEKEGIEKAFKTIQCELLFTKLLTEEQLMKLFTINEEEIKKLKEIIDNPKWLIVHYDVFVR